MTQGNQDTPPTPEQAEEYTLYWASKSPAERAAEAWRLSVEEYGLPHGSLSDGPYRLIQRIPGGEDKVIREWSGPNPLRHV